MQNRVYLGEVEKAVLADLAEHPNTLISPISVRQHKEYSNVHDAINNLVLKECVTPGEKVKSKKGVLTRGYKLTDLGILYVFLSSNIDYDRVEKNYPTDSFIVEYRKILKALPNKGLVKKLLRKAALLALDQDDREAINFNPDALLCMSIDSMRFYGKLEGDEKETVQNLADKCTETIHGNRRLKRAWKNIVKSLAELKE